MPRYVIHAKDAASGQVARKVFEADTGDAARAMAAAIGLEVLAIEVDDESGQSDRPGGRDTEPNPFATPTQDLRDRPETDTWSGTPSQWTNFWWFAACVLIVPIPIAVWKYLSVNASVYTVTTQRIRVKTGVLNQNVEEIELYRVKDTELARSLFERFVGLGTVTVVSSDETTPRLELRSVPDAEGLREAVRTSVEAVRRARGVRELDVS